MSIRNFRLSLVSLIVLITLFAVQYQQHDPFDNIVSYFRQSPDYKQINESLRMHKSNNTNFDNFKVHLTELYWVSTNQGGVFSQFQQLKLMYIIIRKYNISQLTIAPIKSIHYTELFNICEFFKLPNDIKCEKEQTRCFNEIKNDDEMIKSLDQNSSITCFNIIEPGKVYTRLMNTESTREAMLKALVSIDLPLIVHPNRLIHYNLIKRNIFKNNNNKNYKNYNKAEQKTNIRVSSRMFLL